MIGEYEVEIVYIIQCKRNLQYFLRETYKIETTHSMKFAKRFSLEEAKKVRDNLWTSEQWGVRKLKLTYEEGEEWL